MKAVFLTVVSIACVLAEQNDSANMRPKSECHGKVRLGEPCNDGWGICMQVSDRPGNRFEQMECKKSFPEGTVACPGRTVYPDQIVYAPGLDISDPNSTYSPSVEKSTVFTAPEGIVLLTFCGVEIECGAGFNPNCWSPDDDDNCKYDYLEILENGVSKTDRICGTASSYVYQSTAPSVTVVFHSDSSSQWRGYQLEVAYVPE